METATSSPKVHLQVSPELRRVVAAIDELVAAGASATSDGTSVEVLYKQAARLDAHLTKSVGEFETWAEWADDGAHGAAPWLATRCHVPMKEARMRVRRARKLRQLPMVEAAYGEGSISSAHVDAFIGVHGARTEECLDRDEKVLVDQAKGLRFSEFKVALDYWEQLADPDGTEDKAQRQRDRRNVWLVPSLDGMYLGGMILDSVSGSIVAGELERIERAMYEADMLAAKGKDAPGGVAGRSAEDRRTDALVEMAARSRTAPAGGRRPEPLFTVLIDYPTFSGRMCQLANRQVVTPGSLVTWLSEAMVERAVFGPKNRIEVSETTRLFTGATRRALEIRDLCCCHEYCEEPPDRCEGDHIQPASEGGLTNQANGRLLCGFHNRLRNEGRPPQRE
jgi:hypothetical protein